MNIGTYYDSLPDVDVALEIWNDAYVGGDESCLCVYGVTDAEVTVWFAAANTRGEELAQKTLEVTIKPLLWFDSRETALGFMEFANRLTEADFYDLLVELQHGYNTPWTYAQKLNGETVGRIVKNWERRQGDDRR